MIVITLSVCPASLKGDLTKWLFEISPGTYVGEVSARIRERLWERICKNIGTGRACMVYGVRSEMHFAFRTIGETWVPEDFDGITLMKHPMKHSERNPESVRTSKQDSKEQSAATYNVKPSIPDSYVILDLETTGLDPLTDQIIEIGMIRVIHDSVVETFKKYIRIDHPVPEFIINLTGITEKTLREFGLSPVTAIRDTLEFIGNDPVACHNAEFDLSFLKEAAKKLDIEFPTIKTIDTLSLARRKITGIPNYRLNTLIQFLRLSPEPAHEALHDCYAVHALLSELKKI